MSSPPPHLFANITNLKDGPYIRLLHLHPRQQKGNDDHEILNAELTVVPLDSNLPPFEALSYVWGSKTAADGQLLVNDTPITNASENLILALRNLRFDCDGDDGKGRDRILWVDALCINQADDEEKSQQVAMMRRIYASADGVLVWLGPADLGSDLAFRFLESVALAFRDGFRPLNQDYIDAACRDLDLDWESIVRLADQHAPRSRKWEPLLINVLTYETHTWLLGELLRREWWSRVWVIQEICHARKATLWCGDRSVSWEFFAFVMLFLVHRKQNYYIPVDLSRYHSLILMRLRTVAEGSSSKRPDLLEVLASFRWCRATRPVDRVYAVLGLVEGTRITPDYAIDVETCYTESAREILLQTQTLDLLDFVAPPVPPTGIWQRPVPSWVPNWTMYDRAGLDGEALQALRGFARLSLGFGKTSPLPPMGNSQPRFKADTLTLQGIELDAVVATGRPIRSDKSWFMSLRSAGETIRPTDQAPSTFANGDNMKELFKYLYVGRHRGKVHAFRAMVDLAEEAFALFDGKDSMDRRRFVSRLIPLLLHSANETELYWRAEKFQRDWGALKDGWVCRSCRFNERMLSLAILLWVKPSEKYAFVLAVNAGLCVAVTRDNRLCLVPPNCRVRDRVVLLSGARHPFIVRGDEKSDRRTLVGPCYVSQEEMCLVRKTWDAGEKVDMDFQ